MDGDAGSQCMFNPLHAAPAKLYCPAAPTLAKFTLFSNLPAEIRLKIWRTTFPPPRRVEFGAIDPDHPLITKPPPPPVTLFVNQENRAETRKHYDVVHYNHKKGTRNDGNEECLKWVTFICPERDTLVIKTADVFFRFDVLSVTTTQLRKQLMGGLESIRAVEFTKWNWLQVFHQPMPGLVELNTNIWWAIKSFRGMRTLDFILAESSEASVAPLCQSAVVAFFEKHKVRYNGGVAPKVSFFKASGFSTLPEV